MKNLPIHLLCLIAACALPARAQDPGAPSAMEQLQALQARAREINQILVEIQESTFEARPAMAERRDSLMADVDAKMLEGDFDAPTARAEMDSLIVVYQDSTVSEVVRLDVQQQIQSGQTAYQQAQQFALQDARIQETSAELNEDLMAAMKEEDPRAADLLDEMSSIRQQFQMLMQRAQREQMQQQAPVVPQQDPEGQR